MRRDAGGGNRQGEVPAIVSVRWNTMSKVVFD